MEEGNTTPGQVALRYGLIGGLILVAWGLISQLAGLMDMENLQSGTNRLLSFVNYGVMIVVIVLAIRAYMGDHGGIATFGRAFKVGFLTTLVMAVISLIWTYIYFGLIDSSFVETMKEASMEQMIEQQGLSEEDAENAMGMMGFMFNPVGMAIMGGISLTFMGTIFSLVIAAIMKKNPPETI